MARHSYTDEQKRKALELYRTDGPTAVQEQLGIPKSTVRQWARKAGVCTVRVAKTHAATEAAAADNAVHREALKLEARVRALDLIDRMERAHVEFVGKDGRRETLDKATATACREYAVAAGILIDKAELLDGRATGRMDFRNMDQIDRELERMLEEAARTNGNHTRQPA